ncbi:4Fe-4S dicluster domain-containing protein [Thermanaeromonas toyohensis ToBE]|uniref:4Fe-4S dicluster domain-containing protein n=1 Tax=Thermanaeromonas toyohensis ToBE TaxID=698762 RepID=A0A1W1VV16_9FIRM|nr:4Fe-4S dicluster domain-containing protein [Thermanaeromonas toyohensis]SMB97217.1 4Fe-4S dicluster domain-containing protein [Thermanaeromonas toyohensis ToBE]
MKVLTVYPERCVGCRICEQWCSFKHEGQVNPTKSRIHVLRLHEKYLNIPVTCMQCAQSPCISACREEALTKDPQTGAILVNEKKCIGCRRCIRACPYGAISLDKIKKVVLICDLCGGDPQCVAHCRERAIEYIPFALADRGYREECTEVVVRIMEGERKLWQP